MISVLFAAPQWLRVILSLIYLGIVAVLSLLPANDLPQLPLFSGADKIIHTFLYAGLTWMVCWMIYADKKQSKYFLSAILSITWGVLMEFCQFYMKLGRSFDYFDIVGNSIGTLSGLLIFKTILNKYKPLITNL